MCVKTCPAREASGERRNCCYVSLFADTNSKGDTAGTTPPYIRTSSASEVSYILQSTMTMVSLCWVSVCVHGVGYAKFSAVSLVRLRFCLECICQRTGIWSTYSVISYTSSTVSWATCTSTWIRWSSSCDSSRVCCSAASLWALCSSRLLRTSYSSAWIPYAR